MLPVCAVAPSSFIGLSSAGAGLQPLSLPLRSPPACPLSHSPGQATGSSVQYGSSSIGARLARYLSWRSRPTSMRLSRSYTPYIGQFLQS